MRKFKCTAIVMEWVDNDMIEKWDAVDYITAEDELDARGKFIDGIEEQYDNTDVEVDIDDINVVDIGAADVILSVRLTDYTQSGYTMTVGELCKYLEENFDEDSKIYLGEYSGMVARYGNVSKDCFEYAEEE